MGIVNNLDDLIWQFYYTLFVGIIYVLEDLSLIGPSSWHLEIVKVLQDLLSTVLQDLLWTVLPPVVLGIINVLKNPTWWTVSIPLTCGDC